MTADDDPAESPDGDCEQVALDAEAMAACKDLDRQDLLFLKALPDVVDKLRDMTSEGEHNRVQWAANKALIAIAERVARICRRDVCLDADVGAGA